MSDTTNTPDEPDGGAVLRTGEQPVAGGDGADAATNGVAPTRPSPGPRTPAGGTPTVPAGGGNGVEPDPVPAGGPVPSPGPGAAAPPPWRRMPQHETADARAAVMTPVPSAQPDLLDEIPTAFVEPTGSPEPSSPTADGATAGASAGERPGWSSVRARVGPPRRASLQLKRLDPWSVLKISLVLSGVLFLIFLVAVGLLYGVLDGMGVWDRLNGTYSDLVSGDGSGGGEPLISAWRVLGYTAFIGAINSVLFAAALTVGAFVYNVCADLVGGIEVTLSERD